MHVGGVPLPLFRSEGFVKKNQRTISQMDELAHHVIVCCSEAVAKDGCISWLHESKSNEHNANFQCSNVLADSLKDETVRKRTVTLKTK